jgi:hypothetical protein
MVPFLMICLHLIPIAMMIWICLLMTCLTILLRGPRRAAMILTSVWLAWKLRWNGAVGSRQKLPRVSLHL